MTTKQTLALVGTAAVLAGSAALTRPEQAIEVRDVELAEIAARQEAYAAKHGVYEQVTEAEAEAYFGAPLKYPTRIDVFEGPDGKSFEIVERIERPRTRGTSTTDKEVVVQRTPSDTL